MTENKNCRQEEKQLEVENCSKYIPVKKNKVLEMGKVFSLGTVPQP